MIRWRIQPRLLVQWTVWDLMVKLPDGRIVELIHGMSENLAIANAVDRMMDYHIMKRHMEVVNSSWEERTVYKAMTEDG